MQNKERILVVAGLSAALIVASSCGPTEEELGVSVSELPIRGTWELVGTAVFELAPEVEPAEELEPDELEPGQLVTSEEQDQLLMREEPEEGHRPIIVTSNGQMFERVDSVERIFQGIATEGWLPNLNEEMTPGEVEDEIEKTVFGGDNRTLWGNTTSYPARAHVALRNGANATRNFCSAAMIGPRHVLTAGHCFHKDGAFTKSRSNIRVVWGQDGNGNAATNTPLGKRSVVAWVFPRGWVNNNNYRYDYALLILADSTYSPGWLGFAAYSWRTLRRLNVNVNGYPGHGHPCAASPITSGDDRGKCAGYLYHGFGSISMVFSSSLYTRVDWQSGQSGGPVYRYSNGSRRLVGVVSRHSVLWNKATRLRSGVFNSLCDWIGDFPSAHFDHDCY